MRGRVERRHRVCQHLGQALHDLGVLQLLQILHHQHLGGAEDVFEQRHMAFGRRIAQRDEAAFGPVQHLLARRARVLGQALQVVFDAHQRVSQAVDVLRGHRLSAQQPMLTQVIVAGLQQVGGAVQRNHRQRPANLREQCRYGLQMLTIKTARQRVADQVFGFIEDDARFFDHPLVNLHQVGGRQAAFFTLRRLDSTHHARQRGFDVQQRRCHIHQHGIRGFALTLGQALDHGQLVDDDLAWLAETQHGQGVGDLAQGRHQTVEFGHMRAVTAHKQVKTLFDPHQLIAQGGHHRAHGVPVGTGEARTLFVDHCRVGHGFVQLVMVFQTEHFRRRALGLGDVKQQAGEQHIRGRLVKRFNPLRV